MKKMLVVLFMVLFAIGCDNTFLDSECQSDTDCADGDPCTVDICGIDRTCIMVPSDNPACEPVDDRDADADADASTDDYEGDEPGECTDGMDNDRDGLSDCADSSCAGHPVCETPSDADADADADADVEVDDYEGDEPGECTDGMDNDRDGLSDCADSSCAGHPSCEPPPDCVAGRICDCGADGYGVERCSPDSTSIICECPVCGDGICTMFWTRTDTGEGYWNCPEDCPPRCEDGHCATVVLRIACPSDDPDCQIWYSAGGAGEAQAGVLQRYVGSLRCAELAGYLAGININARVGGPDGAWYSDVGRLSDLDVTIDDVPGVCSIESDTMAADNWMVEEGATTNLFCPAVYLSC